MPLPNRARLTGAFLIPTLLGGCSLPARTSPSDRDTHRFPGEARLSHIRKLTSGGKHADSRWSFDGDWLSFQHRSDDSEGPACDQTFRMRPDGSERYRVSNGLGRATSATSYPDGSRLLYSSTFAGNRSCPKAPEPSAGFARPLHPTSQLYSTQADGTDTFPAEPGGPSAYNAEANLCKDGSVVFTSDREGDLELYAARLDRLGTLTGVRRITSLPGYDGGAVFSPDCKRIAWHAFRPRPGKELRDYQTQLRQQLLRPESLEIWVADADGKHARQLTRLGATSFGPTFTPDGERILFSSDLRHAQWRGSNLYIVRTDGTELERVSHSDGFDGFPMLSPDGKRLTFISSRGGAAPGETNLFISDWTDWTEDQVPRPDPLSAKADPVDRYAAIVRHLSSPEMEGRGVGSPGLSRAEAFVERRFREMNLRPFFAVFSRATAGTGYRQRVEIQGKKADNILATWGDACGRTPSIVIGAHLDHLGRGMKEQSLDPDPSRVHPGADDNASGVTGVLEAARLIQSQARLKAKSCFVFAAFTGEEIGIAGSSALVREMKRITALPKAMLNLDMIGRMERNTLSVFGSDSAREWKGLLERECGERGILCNGGGDGYGPSDHMPFYIAGVPVLHFFTGPHLDHHRSTDTVEKVNFTGGVQVTEAVAALAIAAAAPKTRLHYQKAQVAPMMAVTSGKSNRAYLGTIPDYSTLSSPRGAGGGSAPEGGVPLAGVRPGSPADQAGVRQGDVLFLIEVDGPDGKTLSHSIDTLETFTRVLRQLMPGQKVRLGVRREGVASKLPATVGKRE